MAYKTATLFDAVNAAAGATVDTMNSLTPFLQQAADAKLQEQKINIQNWMNDESRKFDGRTDYENFQQEFADDFKDLESQYSGAYHGSYAKTQSQAMLQQAKSSMGEQVTNLIHNGVRNYMTMTNLRSLDELAKQPVSQERLDEQNSIIDNMYADNRIDVNQYYNMKKQYITTAATEDAENWYQTIIAQNPNASDAELNELFDQYECKFTSSTEALGVQKFDFSADTSSAVATAKKNTWARINETREANNTKIKDQNTRLIDDYVLGRSTPDVSLLNIEKQIRTIEGMNNATIDVDQKRQRINELYSYYNQLQNLRSASTSSARTGAQAALDYNSLVKDLKALRSNMMNYGKDITHTDGTTMYGQKEAFDTVCHDKWNEAILDFENKGGNLTDLEYSTIYSNYIQPLVDSWIDDSVKGGFIPSEAGSIISDSIKDVQKYCTDNGAGNISDSYKNYIYDSLFATDYKQFNGDTNKIQDYINEKATQFKDQAIAKKIDNLLNPDSKSYKNGDIDKYSEKNLLTYVSAQKDSLVFTYGDTTDTKQRTTVGKQSQAIWGKGAEMMRRDLTMTMGKAGVDVSSMSIDTTYEPDDNGTDINGTLNFTITGTKDKDGTYRYVPSEDGKSVVLQKKPINITWEEAEETKLIKTVDRDKYQDSIKAERKEAEAAHKAETDAAKQAYKNAPSPSGTGNGYTSSESLLNEEYNKFKASDMPTPPGVSKAEWDKVKNSDDAWTVLTGAFNDNDELYKWLKETNSGKASRSQSAAGQTAVNKNGTSLRF